MSLESSVGHHETTKQTTKQSLDDHIVLLSSFRDIKVDRRVSVKVPTPYNKARNFPSVSARLKLVRHPLPSDPTPSPRKKIESKFELIITERMIKRIHSMSITSRMQLFSN